MNKTFINYFTENNYEINGEFAKKNINGYEVNIGIFMLDNVSPVRIHISTYLTLEQKENLAKSIKLLGIRYLKAQITPYGLLIGLNDLTIKMLLKKLDNIINDIINAIKSVGGLDYLYCPYCGELLNEETKICNINGFSIKLDIKCVELINTQIAEAKEEYKNAPNNYLKGFGGALVGALVGSVIFVILYFIGFFSSISAFVSVLLGHFLYQKFGGKPGKMMALIISLTTIISLLLTVYILYMVAAEGILLEANIEFTTGFEAFNICMGDSEFSRYFVGDLVMTLLFSFIGAGYEVFMMLKNSKNNINHI